MKIEPKVDSCVTVRTIFIAVELVDDAIGGMGALAITAWRELIKARLRFTSIITLNALEAAYCQTRTNGTKQKKRMN